MEQLQGIDEQSYVARMAKPSGDSDEKNGVISITLKEKRRNVITKEYNTDTIINPF